MSAQITVVDPDLAVPENAVELEDKPATGVGPVDGEGFAIPSDAVLWEKTTYGMIAMRIHIPVGYMLEGKPYNPVMRQLDGSPAPVVKVHVDGGVMTRIACLCQYI